jgi:hypothetical protein
VLSLIVPPFSRSCKGAYLDPHTLQALAAKKGYKADILYFIKEELLS